MKSHAKRRRTPIRTMIEQYLKEITTADACTAKRFAEANALDLAVVLRVCPHRQWTVLRRAFLLERFYRVLGEIEAEAVTQDDFSLPQAAARIGLSHASLHRLFKDSWQEALAAWETRKHTFPTFQEYTQKKILATLERLTEADTPPDDITLERVLKEAEVARQSRAAARQIASAYRSARLELARRGNASSFGSAPLPLVDRESHLWDLRPLGGRQLSRDRLRPDLAEIAWSWLYEEFHSRDIAIGTLIHHYRGFVQAGTFLGEVVPDIRQATLEAIQCAWTRAEGTPAQQRQVHIALCQLFTALSMGGSEHPCINIHEMLRITSWLETMVSLPPTRPDAVFLSEDEFQAVLTACLEDITRGMAWQETATHMLTMTTRPNVSENAAAAIYWALALMILIMAFTGLRRESVTGLALGDWVEVRQDLFALAWRHSKKGEEHVAILPAALARLLDRYVHGLAPVRTALGTTRLFLGGTSRGIWSPFSPDQLHRSLRDFVERHHLRRQGVPLVLGSTILRRTFTTRALYEGQSIHALRAQLGHARLSTTFRYGKFDRFEHPAHVREALDEYGRKVLTVWQKPLSLDDLAPEERVQLLGAHREHQQDVGLCRHAHCIKAKEGSPPSCSLCEHLVTGPEFFGAWQAEYRQREQALHDLEHQPHVAMLHAQMKAQFAHFRENFALVQERSQT